MSEPRIFCALDTADLDAAIGVARAAGPVTGGLKIGLELFGAFGPAGVELIQEVCPDAALFLDLKFHDIPNTVSGAVRAVSGLFKPAYLNVHAAGGPEMMRAARESCAPETKLLAVTILTSLSGDELYKTGYEGSEDVPSLVRRMALMAREAGLDGAVCSAHEIEMLREACGPDFVLMVPGVRMEGGDTHEQKRVMTPKCAIEKGADHLVIGRPITRAPDPAAAAKEILESLA